MEMAQRHWLTSDHALAGMIYSGSEWREIGEYTKHNRQQIIAEWTAKGMSREKIEEGLEAFEIMRRGNPTAEERKRLDKIQQDPAIRDFMQDVAENSGVRHEAKGAKREVSESLLQNSTTRSQDRDDLFQSLKNEHCLTATYNGCVDSISKGQMQQVQIFKPEAAHTLDM
jgi:hypothetical protein